MTYVIEALLLVSLHKPGFEGHLEKKAGKSQKPQKISLAVEMALNFGHGSRSRRSKIFSYAGRLRPTVQH